LVVVPDLTQGYFGRGIARRLIESKRMSQLRPTKLSPSELDERAIALAGSTLSLLRWWLDRGAKGITARHGRVVSPRSGKPSA